MQEFDFIVLLSKRFTGEITVEEAAALASWISQAPENARLAEQYQAAWMKSTQVPKTFQVDLDADFLQLKARIQQQDQPVAGKLVPIGRQLLRVAAALIFLVLAVWGYRQFAVNQSEVLVEQVVGQHKKMMELPDGTQVWLREHATLEYPAKFTASERRVKLNGEAYFEVAHNADQPFRVELTDGGLVEVIGTKFNVRMAPEASSVLVREGIVRYAPALRDKGQLLKIGDKAIFNKTTNQLVLSKVSSYNELSWQTGGLEFVRSPLHEVIRDLEEYYQVRIELRNATLNSCTYTAPLINQPIEEVLTALSATFKFKLSSPAPGHYILSKGQCQ